MPGRSFPRLGKTRSLIWAMAGQGNGWSRDCGRHRNWRAPAPKTFGGGGRDVTQEVFSANFELGTLNWPQFSLFARVRKSECNRLPLFSQRFILAVSRRIKVFQGVSSLFSPRAGQSNPRLLPRPPPVSRHRSQLQFSFSLAPKAHILDTKSIRKYQLISPGIS